MACAHGAVWTATANQLRRCSLRTQLSAVGGGAAVWAIEAEQQANAASFVGDATFLAHIAHGIGHGVALGVLAPAHDERMSAAEPPDDH
eukprot:1775856-Prymnesium_polylepis.1